MMVFANLMRAELESADDLEVVVSRVEIPPHTRLPVHFHPGEEFVYVIEGSFVIWQDGEGESRVTAGNTLVVPLRKVHTVHTEEEGATILAFRVHKIGEPERILVDQDAPSPGVPDSRA